MFGPLPAAPKPREDGSCRAEATRRRILSRRSQAKADPLSPFNSIPLVASLRDFSSWAAQLHNLQSARCPSRGTPAHRALSRTAQPASPKDYRMPKKEAQARIRINRLLELAGSGSANGASSSQPGATPQVVVQEKTNGQRPVPFQRDLDRPIVQSHTYASSYSTPYFLRKIRNSS